MAMTTAANRRTKPMARRTLGDMFLGLLWIGSSELLLGYYQKVVNLLFTAYLITLRLIFAVMQLSDEQLSNYARDGYLLLPNFIDDNSCEALRGRAQQLVEGFDPNEAISIFSTHEQQRTTDAYFLESADKTRFFFEENAFAPDRTLRQSKERSINKIGHALHDLDATFNTFSRSDEIKS